MTHIRNRRWFVVLVAVPVWFACGSVFPAALALTFSTLSGMFLGHWIAEGGR